ncbi:malate synthase [Streptomyces sp. AV19]|uniref:malate synthase n=1 Tax=Streptomyces sp. AV19 TaxID=2793068 RepID=UPI0018FE6D79|nr:malate synthase [Streptomyces sp. AV19]MBH1938797.1 malate synthase [Streptomyces sp. AV19]MDG4534730.1 malate synthase [Streptomyces sp. AV19]
MTAPILAPTVHLLGDRPARSDEVLTPEALDFVARLDSAFAGRRAGLLAERRHRAALLAGGGALDHVPATSAVRADRSWRVAAPAPGLVDRRVEITGPPTREGADGASASGAPAWVADFADGVAPAWNRVVDGQAHVLGSPLTVLVRPRGWHLTEKHLQIAGRPAAAALVDAGLHLFHRARRGSGAAPGPYFCLPQVENHLEARLWNDVFAFAEERLGLAYGTVRATVPVETIGAAFEMEEILYELRSRSAGLAADPRRYLASVVRAFPHRPDFLLPDRAKVTMTAPFLRAYAELLVRTCHRRGAHAIGASAAQVPGADEAAHEAVLARVRLEKEREAEDGFDGSRVAHPDLVPVCRTAFDTVLSGRPHQLERTREDVHVTGSGLLSVHRTSGRPTEAGVRAALGIALRCGDSWLRGGTSVVWRGLVEDAATAETARCQVWQWLRHDVISPAAVLRLLAEEASVLAAEEPGARAEEARGVVARTVLGAEPPGAFGPDFAGVRRGSA